MTTAPETEGATPNQQAQLRSQANLPWHWQWTTSAYFVGRLVAPKIPSYTRLDTNLAWQPSDKISLGPGGAELTQKSSPGILRPRLNGASQPDSAQRVCQAHVAVLNAHERSSRRAGKATPGAGRECDWGLAMLAAFISLSAGRGWAKDQSADHRGRIPGKGGLYFPFCTTRGLASGNTDHAPTIRWFYALLERTHFRARWKAR